MAEVVAGDETDMGWSEDEAAVGGSLVTGVVEPVRVVVGRLLGVDGEVEDSSGYR